jgi:preprotein translocase subunit SecE
VRFGIETELATVAMAKTNPGQFVQQVRQEAAKVTWPSRKETGITTMIVFGFVAIAAVFFFLVDIGLSFIVRRVLELGA